MKIQHKFAHFSGTEVHLARELKFVDGVADTPDDAALAAALAVRGYRSTPDAIQVIADAVAAVERGDPDESWKVAELVSYAETRNIDLGEATKKADILAAVTAAEPADPVYDPADDDPTVYDDVPTKTD